jgi:GNAT superfamily N-acetyltransferase
MNVVPATLDDTDSLLALAAEVEDWFGPMVTDAGFHQALAKNISRGSAFVVRAEPADLLGAILTGGNAPTYRINWLVVAASARRLGVGRALAGHIISRAQRPCQIDVITFGRDHPAAIKGGARTFYERLGFTAGKNAPGGPEGGSRQWFHLRLP